MRNNYYDWSPIDLDSLKVGTSVSFLYHKNNYTKQFSGFIAFSKGFYIVLEGCMELFHITYISNFEVNEFDLGI